MSFAGCILLLSILISWVGGSGWDRGFFKYWGSRVFTGFFILLTFPPFFFSLFVLSFLIFDEGKGGLFVSVWCFATYNP